ncbi:NUDIX hydrolase [Candidatus Nomurabacteria bacterium]|nr:NUDIX hydrolase [Candidatus Nomurabacteria bacterium]
MKLPENTIVASGPVIIENDKVLLNKEIKPSGETPWLFPGGEVEDFDVSFEQACVREAKEEMGIDVTIIRPLRPMHVYRPDAPDKMAILIHYLATRIGEIKPAENISKWNWFDIHNLPDDCAPNIAPVIEEYLKSQP